MNSPADHVDPEDALRDALREEAAGIRASVSEARLSARVRQPALLPKIGTAGLALALAAIGSAVVLRYVDLPPATTPTSPHPSTSVVSTPSSALPSGSPTTPSPPRPTASHTDRDTPLRAAAERVLEQWARTIADAPDTVVLLGDLTRGGGWRGPDANDQKVAFEAGRFVDTERLSTQAPPPREIVWADGSRQEVALVSPADALAAMAEARQRYHEEPCDTCRHLRVTGAELVMVEHMTARGPASVPAWQFHFVRAERPLHPITRVALLDRIAQQDREAWMEDVPGSVAYGGPNDHELTIGFAGSPCAEAERFFGEAVESDVGIVVIVGYRPDPARTPGPCRAMAVGYYVTVELDAAIGDRAVLDLQSGFPIPRLDEDPPER